MECCIESCDRNAYARELCQPHYKRWRRHGDVFEDLPIGRARRDCSVPACDLPADGRGLCHSHYQRWQRTGDGYWCVPVPPELRHLTNGDSEASEHRLVMARHLGRALRPHEVVHHRNGNRTDNRLENLELWSTTQPRGQRVEDKVAYATELLMRYAPHLLHDGANVQLTLSSPDGI